MLKRRKYLIMELLFNINLLFSACSLVVPPRNFLAIKRRNGTYSVHFHFHFYLLLDYAVIVKMSKRVHSPDRNTSKKKYCAITSAYQVFHR